jgi:hypothetical protein
MGQIASIEVEEPFPFTRAAARGIALLGPEDRGVDSLTLPLGLSLWIQRSRIDLEEAIEALMTLRLAVLDAAGLDRRSEPTPLRTGDLRVAVVNLARYLDDLLARAAWRLGTSRLALAEQALLRDAG